MNKNQTSKAKATTQATATTVVAQPTPQAGNYTLVYRKAHPGNRVSYGVAGVAGIVVVDLKLFANGKAPSTIVLDCALAVPVAKVAKEKPVPVA